jgi:carboxyl-terminal processing protease
MNARLLLLVASPLVLLAAALGFLAAEARARPRPATIYWPEEVVEEMRVLVEREYVEEVPPERARELFFAACKAYLGALDEYCEFYTPEERRSMEQDTQGEFGGVGVLLEPAKEGEGVLVRGARMGDPAWKAGIRAGDRLVAVDGVEVPGAGGAAGLPRLKGEPGTAVRVAWVPKGGGPRREASVLRAKVKKDSVLGTALLDGEAGIGYLRVARFQDNTAADMKAALARLRASGARSLVLDLRSDYGGVLPAAVACADGFLASGPIVVTRTRAGIEKPGHEARPDPDDLLDVPLVVLVDGNTASASEVLAGALQDHRRAVLAGERTYGKFLVQRIVPLREDLAARITTARYLTPYGRSLQRDDARGVRGGLVPDVPVAPAEAQRAAVAAWFDRQVGLDWDLLPDGAPAPEDPVLAKAMEVLRDAAAVAPPAAAPAPAPGK